MSEVVKEDDNNVNGFAAFFIALILCVLFSTLFYHLGWRNGHEAGIMREREEWEVDASRPLGLHQIPRCGKFYDVKLRQPAPQNPK